MALAPLGDISASKMKDARGLIFDIDDTVTANGRLELAAFEAMWRAKRSGLRLVAVTGRPLGWTDVIARHWPVDLAVGENGAGWAWVEEGRFFHGYYADENARLEHGELLARIRAKMSSALPDVRLADDSSARRCDLAFDAFEECALDDRTVNRAVELIQEEGAKSFVSSVHIHAVPGNWDKACGVRRALKAVLDADIDVENDRWWFVGDSGNDQAAFAFFRNSVGVANITAHLERIETPPRYVTKSERGQGFAELVAALLSARVG